MGIYISLNILKSYKNNKLITFFLIPVVYYTIFAGIVWSLYYLINFFAYGFCSEVVPILGMYEKDIMWSTITSHSIMLMFYLANLLRESRFLKNTSKIRFFQFVQRV